MDAEVVDGTHTNSVGEATSAFILILNEERRTILIDETAQHNTTHTTLLPVHANTAIVCSNESGTYEIQPCLVPNLL